MKKGRSRSISRSDSFDRRPASRRDAPIMNRFGRTRRSTCPSTVVVSFWDTARATAQQGVQGDVDCLAGVCPRRYRKLARLIAVLAQPQSVRQRGQAQSSCRRTARFTIDFERGIGRLHRQEHRAIAWTQLELRDATLGGSSVTVRDAVS